MKLRNALLLVLLASLSHAAPETEQDWNSWFGSQIRGQDLSVVQARTIAKAGRFQITGPGGGFSSRGDYESHYFLSLGSRYHFTENHSWEVFRILSDFSSPSDAVTEIRARTGFIPDTQQARYSLSTAYTYTPIYGKYAWNENSLVHFDIYGLVGAGVRLAQDTQPFGEIGIGMNHYVLGNRLSIVPEIRAKFYSEQRTRPTFVSELFFQLGVAWLL